MKEACDIKVLQALNMFRCCQDKDVEKFLREKAIDYDKRNVCRVFLILDEMALSEGRLNIVAYFTLSQRSILFNSNVSKTTIKNIAKFKDRDMSEFILIGQLGKYKEKKNDGTMYSVPIKIDDILDYIIEVVNAVETYIPCKALLIECNEIVHQKNIYKNCKYPFKFLQYDGEYYQYFRVL